MVRSDSAPQGRWSRSGGAGSACAVKQSIAPGRHPRASTNAAAVLSRRISLAGGGRGTAWRGNLRNPGLCHRSTSHRLVERQVPLGGASVGPPGKEARMRKMVKRADRTRCPQGSGHGVRAHRRQGRGGAVGDPRVRHHHPRVARAQGLARRTPRRARGHGGHRGVLEARRAPRGVVKPGGDERAPPPACRSRPVKLRAA